MPPLPSTLTPLAATAAQKQIPISNEMKRIIMNIDISVIGRVDRLLRSSLVFSEISKRFAVDRLATPLAEDDFVRLTLAGGLMARLAASDEDVDDAEMAVMRDILQRQWKLNLDEAHYLAEVAACKALVGLDLRTIGRKFAEYTTPADRLGFLQALVQVSQADGQIREAEVTEIRSIGEVLDLDEDDIDAVLAQVPRLV